MFLVLHREEAQLLFLELFQRLHAHVAQVGLDALLPATDAGCGFDCHGPSRRRLLLAFSAPQRVGTAVDRAGIADDAESLDKVPVSVIAV